MRNHRCCSKIVAACCLLVLVLHDAQALSQTWEVTMGYRSPDCIDKPVILVNGEFPGPLLRVSPGERIEITVKNKLPNHAIAVHFHGQNQVGTPYMDGATMVSSCPTGPHQTFKYDFKANNESGTFMYHLHIGGMRHLGMYGMLIAEDRPGGALYRKDLAGDHDLIVSEWHHAGIDEIITGLLSPEYRWPGDAQSILINGKGRFGCTAGETNDEEDCSLCPGPHSLELVPGGKYRLRIASATSQGYLNVAIENHTMTVIEVDGNPITPITVPSLDVASGQRYSVLIDADQPPAAYRVSMAGFGQHGPRATYSVLKYASAAPADPGPLLGPQLLALHPTLADPTFGFAQADQWRGLEGVTPLPPSQEQVTKRMVLQGRQERFDDGVFKNDGAPADRCEPTPDSKGMRWSINRVTYEVEQDTPVAFAVYNGDTARLTAERGYIAVQTGDVVDIVIQNYRICSGFCIPHPWHLHGHHFWVVGQGNGEWTGSDAQLASLKSGNDAVLRDTVTVHSDSFAPAAPSTPCGWVVIRFKADNPGAWNLHCHLEWHTMMGMRTVIWYSDSSLPEPPTDTPCFAPRQPRLAEAEAESGSQARTITVSQDAFAEENTGGRLAVPASAWMMAMVAVFALVLRT